MNIHTSGIPTFAGALYSGTEMTPQALRRAGLIEQLQAAGHTVTDLGDLALPPYLPKHNIGPVRNWPAPRMVWDVTLAAAREWFTQDSFHLILGGDCSIIVGTATAWHELHGDRAHLLVLDGHLDVMRPRASSCIGAAGMGLWFLTQDDDIWWPGDNFPASRIAALGCQAPPEQTYDIPVTLLSDMRDTGVAAIAEQYLSSLPSDACVLLHFDVDALEQTYMPAAYSPSQTGLTLEQCRELLTRLLADPRIQALEVTEFSALRDPDGRHARTVAEFLPYLLRRK